MKLFKLLSVLCLLNTSFFYAQITKGNWMVGGSANFTNYNTKYYSNDIEQSQTGYGIQISPNIGYFFWDKLAVGSSLGFGYSNPSGSNNNSTSFGISPFVKYYFLKSDKLINIFAQGSYGFSTGKSETGSTSSSSGYSIKAGPTVFLNSSVAFELALEYLASKDNDNTSSKYFIVGFGFQMYLEKK